MAIGTKASSCTSLALDPFTVEPLMVIASWTPPQHGDVPADLRDLLTGHQSTQGLEFLPQPPDLAVAWTTGGLFVALVEAGEPLGTVALIARASAITRWPRRAAAPIPAPTGRRSSAH